MTTTVETAPAPAPQSSPAPVRPPAMLLVTGLSGAGRSTALKVLEDLGYEAMDNLPLRLLKRLSAEDAGAARALAVGVDSRTRGFTPEALLERLEGLRKEGGIDARLLVLVCDEETLRRRFTATRRRHPLALDRPIADGIRREWPLLAPLRARADLVIDTTELAIGDLRRLLHGHFALDRKAASTIAVTSFSYRCGLPREADLVFDVRFLDNPHYVEALRPLSGEDAAVGRFIEADPAYGAFFDGLVALIGPLLARYEREGKSYLTIAVGCTGGRHRSVYVAHRLAEWLGRQGREASVTHRDLARLADEAS